jgi:hypothetical protein
MRRRTAPADFDKVDADLQFGNRQVANAIAAIG